MTIYLTQNIVSEPFNASLWIVMHKEYKSSIIPHKGDLIADTAYESDISGMKIVEVAIDYANDTCFVAIENYVLKTTSRDVVEKYRDMMKLHGWTCNV